MCKKDSNVLQLTNHQHVWQYPFNSLGGFVSIRYDTFVLIQKFIGWCLEENAALFSKVVSENWFLSSLLTITVHT